MSAAIDFARLPRAGPALRRLRRAPSTPATGTCGRSSSSTTASTAWCRARTTSAAFRWPRSRSRARACCRTASTASARRCSTTRTTSATSSARRWCARPTAERIESEANYAVFRTKLNELTTVFNVGRYLDVVVATPGGLKFASRARRLRQRDDPQLDHLSDLRHPHERPGPDRSPRLDDVRRQRRHRASSSGGREIAIYRVDGSVFATDNSCTHGHARLCEGFLEGHEIECPLHQGSFDVRTGAATGAPAEIALATYPARLAADRVELELD